MGRFKQNFIERIYNDQVKLITNIICILLKISFNHKTSHRQLGSSPEKQLFLNSKTPEKQDKNQNDYEVYLEKKIDNIDFVHSYSIVHPIIL